MVEIGRDGESTGADAALRMCSACRVRSSDGVVGSIPSALTVFSSTYRSQCFGCGVECTVTQPGYGRFPTSQLLRPLLEEHVEFSFSCLGTLSDPRQFVL